MSYAVTKWEAQLFDTLRFEISSALATLKQYGDNREHIIISLDHFSTVLWDKAIKNCLHVAKAQTKVPSKSWVRNDPSAERSRIALKRLIENTKKDPPEKHERTYHDLPRSGQESPKPEPEKAKKEKRGGSHGRKPSASHPWRRGY